MSQAPRSKRQAEAAAQQLLDRMGFTAPIDPTRIAKEVGARVLIAPEGPDSLEGAVVWRDGQPLIIVNGTHPTARQRFTIAHCIAHVLFHKPRVARDIVRREERSKKSWGGVHERLADAFAKGLLMPEKSIRDRTGPLTVFDDQRIRDLAVAFAVPAPMFACRLVDVGLLTPIWRAGIGAER